MNLEFAAFFCNSDIFFGFVTEVFKDEAGLWSHAKSIAQARPEVDHFARLPTSIAMTLQ